MVELSIDCHLFDVVLLLLFLCFIPLFLLLLLPHLHLLIRPALCNIPLAMFTQTEYTISHLFD